RRARYRWPSRKHDERHPPRPRNSLQRRQPSSAAKRWLHSATAERETPKFEPVLPLSAASWMAALPIVEHSTGPRMTSSPERSCKSRLRKVLRLPPPTIETLRNFLPATSLITRKTSV